jgi:cytochrome bd-type quinol oxidase subunit 1
MNYPVWDVPFLGSGWVIGIIAIIHVLISHFAVGGGLFLPMAEAKAIREGRRDWFPQLEAYSKFFLVLTGVFGAMTGVGIWFAIGLVSPEGTSTLIHNFVFAWATEWMVFLVELSLAAAYYYTWNRIPDKIHLRLGWAYAATSWLTLVIINGILTFQLTPGAWLPHAGSGNEPFYFFQALLNPGYFPSLGLRTLACTSLAGIWAMVFFAGMDGDVDGPLKTRLVRWSARWVVPAYVLMPVFFVWYLFTVPESHRALMSLGISTIGAGAFTMVTRMSLITVMTSATMAGVVFFFAWLSPRTLSRGQALGVLFLALMATGSTESVREFLRKPFVINGYLYSNGVHIKDVEGLNAGGYLASSPWVSEATVATSTTLPTPEMGARMFQGQCLACHTMDGYRSLRRLLADRDGKAIGNILAMLHDHKPDSPYSKFMPPLVGTPVEIEALRQYLDRMVNGKLTSPVAVFAPPVSAAVVDSSKPRS